MKTIMTIDQYNKYKTGEITLREIRREHNDKINNTVYKMITNKNVIGIVGLELMFLVQLIVLIFMSNDVNQLNDITVNMLNKFSDTDARELMKSYIEIARIWIFISNVCIYI